MYETISPPARAGRALRTHLAGEPVEPSVRAYGEIEGIGMGLLDSGEAYLTQRGLAMMCGVRNAHIGTISRDWLSDKPRIRAIRDRLDRKGLSYDSAHRVLRHEGRTQYAYDLPVAQAVLAYYAYDAGSHAQSEARMNARRYAGEKLGLFITEALTDRFPVPEVAAKPAPQAKRPDVKPSKVPQDAQDVSAAQAVRSQPLRFTPVTDAEPARRFVVDSFTQMALIYVKLSRLMAQAYIEAARATLQRAPWNRLGLYIPLQAILEMQAELLKDPESAVTASG